MLIRELAPKLNPNFPTSLSPLILSASDGDTFTLHTLLNCGLLLDQCNLFIPSAILSIASATTSTTSTGADAKDKNEIDSKSLDTTKSRSKLTQEKDTAAQKSVEIVIPSWFASPPYTVLYAASNHGHLETVKYVMDRCGESQELSEIHEIQDIQDIRETDRRQQALHIDALDIDGETALYTASFGGHTTVAQLLLDQQAWVDIERPDFGASALHTAARLGHAQTVSVLVKAKANLECKRADVGSTPLFVACENGFLKVVEILCEAKANINSQIHTIRKIIICNPFFSPIFFKVYNFLLFCLNYYFFVLNFRKP